MLPIQYCRGTYNLVPFLILLDKLDVDGDQDNLTV